MNYFIIYYVNCINGPFRPKASQVQENLASL